MATRSAVIRLRVTEVEKAAIERNAALTGESVSEFSRRMLLRPDLVPPVKWAGTPANTMQEVTRAGVVEIKDFGGGISAPRKKSYEPDWR